MTRSKRRKEEQLAARAQAKDAREATKIMMYGEGPLPMYGRLDRSIASKMLNKLQEAVYVRVRQEQKLARQNKGERDAEDRTTRGGVNPAVPLVVNRQRES